MTSLGIVLTTWLALLGSTGATAPLAPLPASEATDRKRVLVAPTVATTPLPPVVMDALHRRIRDGLTRASFELVSATTDPTCGDAACWSRLAAQRGARYQAQLTVEAMGADQRLTLRVTDSVSGEEVLTVARTCELCGRDELLDAATDVSASTARKLAAQGTSEPRLRLDSVPSGAIVLLDGRRWGTTPLDAELPAGAHTLRIQLRGHRDIARQFTAEPGTQESMRVHLDPTPTPRVSPSGVDASPPPARRRARVVIGSVLLGGGVAALGAGAALLYLHARPIERDCSGSRVDADGDCEFLHDTRAGGIAAVVLGASAAITGGVILGLELTGGRDRRLGVSLTPSNIALRGSF